jgi:hypothetical protein
MISGNTNLPRKRSLDHNSYLHSCCDNFCINDSPTAASWLKHVKSSKQTAAPEKIENKIEKEEKQKETQKKEEKETKSCNDCFLSAALIAAISIDNFAFVYNFYSSEYIMPAKQYSNLLPIGVGWRVKPDPGD